MKFSLAQATEFGWDGLIGKALSTKEDFERASGAYFEVTGNHGPTRNKISDRIYFIIDGEGEFEIDGKKYSVENGDMVIAPRDTLYDYRATNGTTLKMFLVHSPAFNQENESKE